MARPSIVALPQLVEALPGPQRVLFERIFHVTAADGWVVPPEAMLAWLEKQFGSLEAVRTQRIVRVTNRLTLEGALFNGLRASRPIEGGQHGGQDLAATIHETAGDPFCHPLTGTPADVFGRVRGGHAITASNVAKYDAWHAVIVFDEHDPLHFDAAQLADYMMTAQAWARQAYEADPQACYPLFLWNCLWRSGASIVHGHAQMVLSRGMPLARVEAWRRAATEYRAAYGSDYFADMTTAMRSLGLAVDHGAAVLFPALTPVKEKEVHILAPRLDNDLTSAIYRAVRVLIDRMGTRSFNLAVYQPPLGPAAEDWAAFPLVARLVDRGPLDSRASDMGAMELFAQSIVTSDPFAVAEELLTF